MVMCISKFLQFSICLSVLIRNVNISMYISVHMYIYEDIYLNININECIFTGIYIYMSIHTFYTCLRMFILYINTYK